MKICPLCNSEYESTENFCKKDGTKLVEKSQPEGKKCPKCGKTYPSEAAFCMFCGLKLVFANSKPTCSNCGAELPDGAAFCMKCGTKVEPESKPYVRKKESIKKQEPFENLTCEKFAMFKRASDNGYAPAQFSLGLCYIDGIGCEKDENYGISLIRLAASNGHGVAKKWLEDFRKVATNSVQ